MIGRNPDFGWSLPPGVRESDIPGCRPEDAEEEVVLVLTRGELEEIDDLGLRADCLDDVVEQIQSRPGYRTIPRRNPPWLRRVSWAYSAWRASIVRRLHRGR